MLSIDRRARVSAAFPPPSRFHAQTSRLPVRSLSCFVCCVMDTDRPAARPQWRQDVPSAPPRAAVLAPRSLCHRGSCRSPRQPPNRAVLLQVLGTDGYLGRASSVPRALSGVGVMRGRRVRWGRGSHRRPAQWAGDADSCCRRCRTHRRGSWDTASKPREGPQVRPPPPHTHTAALGDVPSEASG